MGTPFVDRLAMSQAPPPAPPRTARARAMTESAPMVVPATLRVRAPAKPRRDLFRILPEAGRRPLGWVNRGMRLQAPPYPGVVCRSYLYLVSSANLAVEKRPWLAA